MSGRRTKRQPRGNQSQMLKTDHDGPAEAKELLEYIVENKHTETLEALGFKEHCERFFIDKTSFKFDHENGCVRFKSTLDTLLRVQKEAFLFLKEHPFFDFSCLKNKPLLVKLLHEKKDARLLIEQQLSRVNVNGSFVIEEGAFGLRCFYKHHRLCSAVLDKYIQCCIHEGACKESLHKAQHVAAQLKDESYAVVTLTKDTSSTNDLRYYLIIAITAEFAPGIFKFLEENHLGFSQPSCLSLTEASVCPAVQSAGQTAVQSDDGRSSGVPLDTREQGGQSVAAKVMERGDHGTPSHTCDNGKGEDPGIRSTPPLPLHDKEGSKQDAHSIPSHTIHDGAASQSQNVHDREGKEKSVHGRPPQTVLDREGGDRGAHSTAQQTVHTIEGGDRGAHSTAQQTVHTIEGGDRGAHSTAQQTVHTTEGGDRGAHSTAQQTVHTIEGGDRGVHSTAQQTVHTIEGGDRGAHITPALDSLHGKEGKEQGAHATTPFPTHTGERNSPSTPISLHDGEGQEQGARGMPPQSVHGGEGEGHGNPSTHSLPIHDTHPLSVGLPDSSSKRHNPKIETPDLGHTSSSIGIGSFPINSSASSQSRGVSGILGFPAMSKTEDVYRQRASLIAPSKLNTVAKTLSGGLVEQGRAARNQTQSKEDMPTPGIPVTIPSTLTKLLKKNDFLVKCIVHELTKRRVHIDGNDISNNGLITIVHGGSHSAERVYHLLDELVLFERIPEHVKDEVEEDLERLLKNFPTQTALGSERGNIYELVYETEIHKEIESVLHKLKHKEIKIHILPRYLLRMRSVELTVKELQANLGGIATQFGIEYAQDKQTYLVARPAREVAAQVEQEAFRLLGKLVFREKQIPNNVGRLIQSKDYSSFVRHLEETHGCTVQVQTPECRVLLRAWSPLNGHNMMLCEGRLNDATADVLVLPLQDGQKEWPSAHRRILERALLSTSVGAYSRTVGSQPDKRKTLMLNGNGALAGRKVMLMAVPNKDDSMFKKALRAALQGVLATVDSNTSIAFPLHLSAVGHSLKPWKVLVHELTETLALGKLLKENLDLSLWQEPSEAGIDLDMKAINLHLVGYKWTTWGWIEPNTAGSLRACVVVEDLLKKQADILVNSTDPDLKHDRGTVSKLVSEKAGGGLVKQCEDLYPEGMEQQVVAVTDSFNMDNYTQIFHISLHQTHWPKDRAVGGDDLKAELLENLKMHVQSCLVLASAARFRSIVFPSLGTGVLGYPADKVAQIMFTTTEEFFKETPGSSLLDVFLCCHGKDKEIVTAFRVEETIRRFKVRTSWNTDAKATAEGAVVKVEKGMFDKKRSTIQLVEEDSFDCRPVGDQLIMSNSRLPGNLDQFSIVKNIHWIEKPDKSLSDKIKSAMGKTSGSCSVQINLATFEPSHFDAVLHGVTKHVEGQAQHVVLVVPKDEFDLLLKSARKEWGKVCSYSDGISARKTSSSLIQVCGQKKEVDLLLKEVKEIKESSVSHTERLTAAASEEDQENEDDSSVSDLEEEELDGYTFSIPKKSLTEADMNKLLKDVKGKHKKSQQRVQFYLSTREECQTAFDLVHSFISERHNPKNDSVQVQKSQSHVAEGAKAIECDSMKRDALQVLMKEEFSKVNVKDIGQSKVKISFVGSGTIGHNLMERIDSLRQEEVMLGSADFQKIPSPLDTAKEGVAAYMVPVPEHGKVVIFSFDYSALAKAKHLLNVKLGKVKVTTRSRRRFDAKSSGMGDETADQSPPSSLTHDASQTTDVANTADFDTASGIKVSVYRTDITKLPLDAIVNAANGYLAHGGGVANAISKAAGYHLEEEGDDYVDKHGPLKVTEVVETTAGALPCKKVLHAVGPRWDDYKDKEQCQRDLHDTVYNCLVKADRMQFASLALPSISSAIFGVPKDVCTQSYLAAVQKFDKDRGGRTSVKYIHFVDVSEDMVSAIQKTFRQNWDSDQKVTLTSNSGSEQRKQSKPDSTEEISQASGISGEAPHQPLAAASTLSAQGDLSFPTLSVCSTSPEDPAYQFCFESLELNLVVKRGKITDVKTEALVLWQECGNVGKDETSKQWLQCQSKSVWMPSSIVEGLVLTVDADSVLLVLPGVARYVELDEKKVQDLVEKSIQAAAKCGKKSLTLTDNQVKHGGISASNKSVTAFAKGVYAAVKNYTQETDRCLKTITIIHEDPLIVTNIHDTVCELVALDKSLHESAARPANDRNSGSTPRSGVDSRSDECTICINPITNPATLSCGHSFCSPCIDRWLGNKSTCPCCNKIQGVLTGTQPVNGTMDIRFYSYLHLPGYERERCGYFTIMYYFPAGQQTEKHLEPGRPYSKETRKAYVPNTQDGRRVLMLLKIAFDRHLVFTVGQSATMPNHVGITWNDIHHKTSLTRDGEYGYPDPNYFPRVTKELEGNGVTEKDCTDKQKDFIQNFSESHRYLGFNLYKEF